MSSGWTGNILKVDLTNRQTSTIPTEPYMHSFIGGRGISVKMMYDQVDPKLSPFDPGNDLFFGPGVLTGTPAAGSSRLKISALGAGGYLRHAGLGGDIANAIKWAGYDLIVIQGKLDEPSYMYIHDDEIEFRDAGHIWGHYTYDTEQMVKDEIGKSAAVESSDSSPRVAPVRGVHRKNGKGIYCNGEDLAGAGLQGGMRRR